nr:uncharacterized protein LOC112736422 [Arachis hypogaea]
MAPIPSENGVDGDDERKRKRKKLKKTKKRRRKKKTKRSHGLSTREWEGAYLRCLPPMLRHASPSPSGDRARHSGRHCSHPRFSRQSGERIRRPCFRCQRP